MTASRKTKIKPPSSLRTGAKSVRQDPLKDLPKIDLVERIIQHSPLPPPRPRTQHAQSLGSDKDSTKSKVETSSWRSRIEDAMSVLKFELPTVEPKKTLITICQPRVPKAKLSMPDSPLIDGYLTSYEDKLVKGPKGDTPYTMGNFPPSPRSFTNLYPLHGSVKRAEQRVNASYAKCHNPNRPVDPDVVMKGIQVRNLEKLSRETLDIQVYQDHFLNASGVLQQQNKDLLESLQNSEDPTQVAQGMATLKRNLERLSSFMEGIEWGINHTVETLSHVSATLCLSRRDSLIDTMSLYIPQAIKEEARLAPLIGPSLFNEEVMTKAKEKVDIGLERGFGQWQREALTRSQDPPIASSFRQKRQKYKPKKPVYTPSKNYEPPPKRQREDAKQPTPFRRKKTNGSKRKFKGPNQRR